MNIVAEYEHALSSPSFSMKIPSVVCLKSYIKPSRHPPLHASMSFLRDRFECQYCGSPDDLTFDHVIPRRCGGQTTWENVVAACSPCNLKKGGQMPREAQMFPRQTPFHHPCTIFTTMAGFFRRTICMKAGWIISTGMSNCSLEPAASPRCQRGWAVTSPRKRLGTLSTSLSAAFSRAV